MRLSEFLRDNTEKIISEWETFARTFFPKGAEIDDLRDHAREMLAVIARDLDTPQTEREGTEKSAGRSDADESGSDTPAQSHGSGRAHSGLTIQEMVSEYRALRSSVIRLWIEAAPELRPTDIEDLVRFNEAIDQALAESTARFADDLGRTKETFLAILGHDLRTPLGAIVTSAHFIQELDDLSTAQKMAALIVSSGRRMNHMVDDLVDFTRGRLGSAMPVERRELDLGEVLAEAIEEVEASRPEAAVELKREGDLCGEFDAARLRQVFGNLMDNAITYGSEGAPVRVSARGQGSEIIIAVNNVGSPIDRSRFEIIFDPMTRGASGEHAAGHLGLGLYIVKQIVAAHHGTVSVESDAPQGTTFTIRLPRAG